MRLRRLWELSREIIIIIIKRRVRVYNILRREFVSEYRTFSRNFRKFVNKRNVSLESIVRYCITHDVHQQQPPSVTRPLYLISGSPKNKKIISNGDAKVSILNSLFKHADENDGFIVVTTKYKRRLIFCLYGGKKRTYIRVNVANVKSYRTVSLLIAF